MAPARRSHAARRVVMAHHRGTLMAVRLKRQAASRGAQLTSRRVLAALRHGRIIARRAWADAWVCMEGRNIGNRHEEPTDKRALNPYRVRDTRPDGPLLYSPPGGGLRPFEPSPEDREASDWVVMW